jgi:hypothetical protein
MPFYNARYPLGGSLRYLRGVKEITGNDEEARSYADRLGYHSGKRRIQFKLSFFDLVGSQFYE